MRNLTSTMLIAAGLSAGLAPAMGQVRDGAPQVAQSSRGGAAVPSARAQEAFNRGVRLAQAGNIDGAIAAWTEAIRLNPHDPSAYLERSTAFLMKEDHERAFSDLNEVLRLDPSNARAYNNRGMHYRERGDVDRALADFNQAIRFAPDYTRAYYNRGSVLAGKGDFDAALRDFDEAIRLDPTASGGYVDRGNAYLGKGDPRRAAADFEVALRMDPDNLDAYQGRGFAYAAQGNLDRAIADFGIIIRKAPTAWIAYLNRGNAYLEKGDPDRAIKDLSEAIRLNPQGADAFLNRGVAFKKKGQLDEAIADYDQAIRLNPNDAVTYSNRAIAHRDVGSLDKALKDFEAALKIDPTSEVAEEGRRKAEAILGERDDRIWTYARKDRTIAFGMPRGRRTLRLACTKRGVAEIEIAKVEGEFSDGQSFILDLDKDGQSTSLVGSLQRSTFGGETGRWTFTATLSSGHRLFDLLKESGTLQIKTEDRTIQTIRIDGAAGFTEAWQDDCQSFPEVSEWSADAPYTMVCRDEILASKGDKIRTARLKRPFSATIEYADTQSIRREWSPDGNGGWEWQDAMHDDLVLTIDGRKMEGGRTTGSSYEASTTYDGEFVWAWSRELSAFSLSTGGRWYLCKSKAG